MPTTLCTDTKAVLYDPDVHEFNRAYLQILGESPAPCDVCDLFRAIGATDEGLMVMPGTRLVVTWYEPDETLMTPVMLTHIHL